MMSKQERNKRRALIVRRWAAYRTGCAQRKIWRRRREVQGDDPDEVGDGDEMLAELPDALIS